MFWKFIIGLLDCKTKDYLKAVPMGKEVYFINIKKYVSPEEELKKWKDALGETRTLN